MSVSIVNCVWKAQRAWMELCFGLNDLNDKNLKVVMYSCLVEQLLLILIRKKNWVVKETMEAMNTTYSTHNGQ